MIIRSTASLRSRTGWSGASGAARGSAGRRAGCRRRRRWRRRPAAARRRPASRPAGRASPTTLLSQYISGWTTDSPAAMSRGEVQDTPSKPASGVSTAPRRGRAVRGNSTLGGTASAWPVDRSSMHGRPGGRRPAAAGDDAADVAGAAGDEQFHARPCSSSRAGPAPPRTCVGYVCGRTRPGLAGMRSTTIVPTAYHGSQQISTVGGRGVPGTPARSACMSPAVPGPHRIADDAGAIAAPVRPATAPPPPTTGPAARWLARVLVRPTR